MLHLTRLGEQISVRLLDKYSPGLRDYADARESVLHELVHNDIGPHDNAFDKLLARLCAEAADFDRQAQPQSQSHRDRGSNQGGAYQPHCTRPEQSQAQQDRYQPSRSGQGDDQVRRRLCKSASSPLQTKLTRE